jgi:hypothetical protein
MERRVGDADKPLTVEEIIGELSLRFERLNMKTSRNEKGEGSFGRTSFIQWSI